VKFIRHSITALTAVLALSAGSALAQDSKPIRFGINASLTGPFGEGIRPTMLADQVWEKDINSRGGLLGRKVEMTFRDNRSSPDDAVSIYQSFSQDNYDFIFENSGAFIVQRESTLAEQRGKLFLAPNGFARSLYERGYKFLFFTGAAVSEDLNIGLVNLLKTLPADQLPKTVGYVTVDNIAFTSTIKGLKPLLEALKISAVADLTYPPNLNDATPLVQNLMQKNPEFVYQIGLNNDSLLFARAMKQQGFKAKATVISLVAGAQPNFTTTFGDSVEGMLYTSPWEPQVSTKGNKQFVEQYKAANGRDPTYNAAQSYARWQILEQAVNATKSLDDTKLRDYIAGAEFDTVVGKMNYKGKGYSVPDDTIMTQIQNGKKVVVWPKSDAGAPFVYPMK
jgi:branched-chain amino acid transport system substrate-binding protein